MGANPADERPEWVGGWAKNHGRATVSAQSSPTTAVFDQSRAREPLFEWPEIARLRPGLAPTPNRIECLPRPIVPAVQDRTPAHPRVT